MSTHVAHDPAHRARQIQVCGIDTEVWEGGTGRTLLLLHPGDGFDPDAAFVAPLAERFRVVAPSCPGFGRSGGPGAMKSVDDLSYFYLDLMEALDLKDAIIVGLSFGGWLAAEIAVKNTSRMAALCLAGTLGAKFGDPMTREIVDLFSVPLYQHPQWLHHDEKLRHPDYAGLSDETATMLARNHGSFGLFGWSPTLHSRHLHQRLHRIKVPTLLVWGAQDRVVPVDYGRKWQQAIPGAEMLVVEDAGHYVHADQPGRFVGALEQFVNSPARR
ncbi:alpha/beta fold hydrolase [Ramlibacter sp.]|uniref:alpha/beta fold hydrolase n=1 Tax=Ramlibacter sp. TaxID=1917967 RepID=UPI003D0C6C74